jgi:hypothetical protein
VRVAHPGRTGNGVAVPERRARGARDRVIHGHCCGSTTTALRFDSGGLGVVTEKTRAKAGGARGPPPGGVSFHRRTIQPFSWARETRTSGRAHRVLRTATPPRRTLVRRRRPSSRCLAGRWSRRSSMDRGCAASGPGLRLHTAATRRAWSAKPRSTRTPLGESRSTLLLGGHQGTRGRCSSGLLARLPRQASSSRSVRRVGRPTREGPPRRASSSRSVRRVRRRTRRGAAADRRPAARCARRTEDPPSRARETRSPAPLRAR